jgi:hypothetical protein
MEMATCLTAKYFGRISHGMNVGSNGWGAAGHHAIPTEDLDD